jgi:hypothetical protein
VSLLAWVPEETQITQLEHLAANDSSGWVRAHAEWAAEVGKQERAARQHYRYTLEEFDRNSVMARLQVIRPALTPSALWWHRDLEKESSVLKDAPGRTKAAISFFWHDVDSTCKETPTLFGRNLGEYLRGERVSDLRSPKPRLIT